MESTLGSARGLIALLLAASWLGCASSGPASAPAPVPRADGEALSAQAGSHSGNLQPSVSDKASKAAKTVADGAVTGAKAVGRGAVAVGKATATAYRGVRYGFQTPESEREFGAYPKDYVQLVKRHFFHILHFPEDTRFEIGPPRRGFMNKGLLRGGGIEWQGYIVEVDAEASTGVKLQRISRHYAVRIRDGGVIEAHRDVRMLRTLEADSVPAKVKPGR